MKSFAYFAPHKTALTCSLVMALGSLIFFLPAMLMFSFMPHMDHQGNQVDMAFPTGFTLVMPIFYFIFGYLGTAFFALCYNVIAKFTGGITFETKEIS